MSGDFELTLPGGSEGADRLAARLQGRPGSAAESAFTLLYLHGFGASQDGEKASFFRRRARQASIPFCSFDFRGHGASAGKIEDSTLSRNLEDVASVDAELRRRGHREIVLLGSSMGALTALWHAAGSSGRIAAALLIAPALGMEKALVQWAGADGMERWRRRGVRRVENELGSFDLGWGFVADLAARDEREMLSRLATPCLVLQGMRDDRVDWRRVARGFAHSAAPGVELHLFADGDHRLVDRKERLWSLMLGFLAAGGLLPAT